jgi:hypothetical protein
MPTLLEWLTALHSEREVLVTSSPDLIQTIKDRQTARVEALQQKGKQPPPFKQNLTPVADFEPDRRILVRPVDVLHAIGITMTPPVPNLVDLSSTWALWRYLWAFSYPHSAGEVLRLSRTASGIDFHQKAVLSDELGVGMASYIMANYLGAPEPVDISAAVRNPALGLRKELTASPDYVFSNPGRTTLYIVECKGSQTRRSAILDQLRRGTEQLPSIVSVNGAALPSLVIGTHLTRRQVEVLVIDPPGETPDREPPGETPDRDPPSEKPVEPVERTGKRAWRVKDQAQFFSGLERIHSAKILSFAGDPAAGVRKLPFNIPKERQRYIRDRRPTVRVETDLGDFIGVISPVPVEGPVRVEMFRGLNTDLRADHVSLDPQRVTEGSHRFAGQFGAQHRATGYFSVEERTTTGIRVRSFSDQGTLLEFRISGEP